LLIAYVFIAHATWESLSPIGVVLSIAFFAAVIWVMVDIGLLSLEHSLVITWVILIVVSTILAVGMSFSLVRCRVTGQIDVDDVDY
jgi:Kef-type K+ transport system membrane component KefB